MRPAPCVIELRRYTLHPGRRDTLIELFERAFVDAQEQSGMTLPAWFREVEQPDRFTWLRGFADMAARKQALQSFYGGPVWQANRDAANATMIDSDDVLLLKPARPHDRFVLRPRVDVVATQCPLKRAGDPELRALIDALVAPALGDSLIAAFVSETAANDFPRLPVREHEPMLVLFTATEHALGARAPSLPADLLQRLARAPEVLRLSPTPQCRLHAAKGAPR